MIEWNKVTWYSRLGALILFLGVVPALTFYIGMQYQLTLLSEHPPIVPIQFSGSKGSGGNNISIQHQGVKDSTSPDGKYTAMRYSTEEYTGTYIVDAKGNLITSEYPGNVVSWFPDSTTDIVFVADSLSKDGQRHIFFLGVDNQYRDSGLPVGTYDAVMLPNGSMAYASSTRMGTDATDLVLRDIQGNDLLLVKGGGGGFINLQWLSKQNLISFEKVDSKGNSLGNWTVDAQGKNLVQLLN